MPNMNQDPEPEGVRHQDVRPGRGSTATLAACVEAGVQVNLAHQKGDTLLMLAAYHGHAETVSMLLDKGADLTGRMTMRKRPLPEQPSRRSLAWSGVLLDAGANPGAGNPSAVDTALRFSSQQFLAWFSEP
jgi:ankyrin repeat protein